MSRQDLMNTFAEIVANLGSLEYADYRESNLPGPVDGRITTLCEIFREATPEERVQLSEMLYDENVRRVLLGYALRMSMESVRAKSANLLVDGLVAIGMMPTRLDLDFADYMALALLYNSATKLGDANRLFNQAARYAVSEEAREFIMHFLKRSPRDRRLEAFGYHEVEGPHGLIYQYANHRIPKGLL
jgi:hypothetical protein